MSRHALSVNGQCAGIITLFYIRSYLVIFALVTLSYNCTRMAEYHPLMRGMSSMANDPPHRHGEIQLKEQDMHEGVTERYSDEQWLLGLSCYIRVVPLP
jgi:hypothetical protein